MTGPGRGGTFDVARAIHRRRPVRAGAVQLGCIVAGLVLALLTPKITIGPTADSRQASMLLQAIGGGLVTFIALVFSLLFLVIQHASTTMSPRLVLFRDLPLVWQATGLFAGVFVFATTASLVVGHTPRVSVVVPALAILLVLACLAAARNLQLAAFAAVQTGLVIRQVTARGLGAIDARYPHGADLAQPAPVTLATVSRQVIWPHQHAVIRGVDVPAILALQQNGEGVIEINTAPGMVLRRGVPAFTMYGTPPAATDAQLLALLDTGADRTFDQDPLLGFRLLTDIALRALSPAINDPETAVQAVDGIEDLLYTLLERDLDSGRAHDAQGRLRVILHTPTWEQYVQAATEVIPYCGHTPTVRSRLSQMLDRLAAVAPASRAGPLRQASHRLT